MRIIVYKNNLTRGRGADYAVRDVCGLLAEAHTVIFITERKGTLSCAFDSRVSVIRIATGHEALASAVSAANPDAIVSTGTDEINALCKAFPVTFPAPVIQQFHIYPPSAFKPRRWIRNFRTKQALRRCSAIQVLLPEYVEPTRQLIRFTGPVVAIGNLVPTNLPISTMPHSGANPVILYPAAFHKWKRQALLIRAFAQLKMQVPNAILELAGHGSVRDEMNLRRLATRLGVKDAVNFLGYVSDLSTALANASIVAFPSQVEGFGLVIVEAAAAGRLTVGCNDCMASRTLIREMGGLLASPTPTALATALAHGLKTAPAYEVPRTALTAYSPDVIRAHWEALLKQCVKRETCKRKFPS